MKAEERTISGILTEQIRYEIPAYQRPYSWAKANVEQLLDDIWGAYVDDDKEYFVGSLITIEREKDMRYEVVDGQQRLTTLNLIFARLRDRIEDPDVRADLAKRVLPRNPYTGTEEKPRLMLRAKDQAFFRKHVLKADEVTDAIQREVLQNEDAPKLRIIENLAAVDQFCYEKDQESLKLFADYMLRRVYVVFVTTVSWQSAYRLFNVLNARGMPLTNADLIKNKLFSLLSGDERSAELDQRWLELEDTVGIDGMDQFLGHHRTSLVPEKARKTLHEEFEQLIAAKDDPFAFLEAITASAKNYTRIASNDFEQPAARRAVRSLQRVAFDDWIPPLLAFMNCPVVSMTPGELIGLLEKITYQNWIRRLAFTARLTVYFQLINAIRAGRPAEDVRAVFRQNAENGEFRSLLDGDVYNRPFARAVLLRIEEADQDESVTKDYGGRITIEHVLPQTLSDPYWQQRFSAEEHWRWLHRLGNLALLAGNKNYRAQNHSFDRKKKSYEERNSKVSFDTTKRVLDRVEWTPEVVAERHREMLEAGVRVWSIDADESEATTVEAGPRVAVPEHAR